MHATESHQVTIVSIYYYLMLSRSTVPFSVEFACRSCQTFDVWSRNPLMSSFTDLSKSLRYTLRKECTAFLFRGSEISPSRWQTKTEHWKRLVRSRCRMDRLAFDKLSILCSERTKSNTLRCEISISLYDTLEIFQFVFYFVSLL